MGKHCSKQRKVNDVEQGKNETEMKCAEQNHDEQTDVREDEQGKRDHADLKKLLEILEKESKKRTGYIDDDIQQIKNILKGNKNLLSYPYYKDNKVRSLVHIAKYSSKINYDDKRKIVGTIVDAGNDLYKFAEDSPLTDNCHALFFAAAKGDIRQLEKIVKYFLDRDKARLHETREGDTVISFMVKFGDCFQSGFLNCLRLMLQQGIDTRRVDYYAKNVMEVIEKEVNFLQKTNANDDHLKKLEEISKVINEFDEILYVDPVINEKYKLFQSIIKRDENFKNILKPSLVDSDDGENTLLQLVIIKNNVDGTKELLAKGADPNRTVSGRNEESPLVLAAKLTRDDIFKEILKSDKIEITATTFAKFIKELKLKYLNSLLESNALNVDIKYKDKTPLYYAIKRQNKKAIQSLLQRGSRMDDIYLESINPKDLEDYLNSCVKFDNFADDMEESNYKILLVFDLFISSNKERPDSEVTADENRALVGSEIPTRTSDSEIAVIQSIGNNKRLKHLLEHPLVYIYIILKWCCVKYYYCYFIIYKFIFYLLISVLVYTGSFHICVVISVLVIQFIVVFYNYSEYRCNFRRYPLHFILEILVLLCLLAIFVLKFVNCFIGDNTDIVNLVNEISAFIIIFTSVSMLLTIGYHMKLSKWMAMAKRVFKNFGILLLFFMIPITAFATSLTLLLPMEKKVKEPEKENEDFTNLPRAIFRTLVMIGGDIGDKKFTLVGGYLVFLLFTVGMAIILLNFWTGVAVSDIKEIEEQSTIVAFKNVIVFIESVERMYKFTLKHIFSQYLCPRIYQYLVERSPFLKSKIKMETTKSEKKNKKYKYKYGVSLYINSQKQFRNVFFENCKLQGSVISKIKSLSEEKEVSIGKVLRELMDKTKSIDGIMAKLDKIEQLLQNVNRKQK